MATVTTTFTPDPQMFGFTTIPGSELPRSDQPRGEVILSEINGTIALTGGSDDQRVVVNVTLPRNFIYVMVDQYSAISGTGADDWEQNSLGTIVMKHPGTNESQFQTWLELVSHGALKFSATDFSRVYQAPRLPKALFLGANNGVNGSFSYRNLNLGGAAASLQFYTRFLMYDIDQFHNVVVNTPSLTR